VLKETPKQTAETMSGGNSKCWRLRARHDVEPHPADAGRNVAGPYAFAGRRMMETVVKSIRPGVTVLLVNKWCRKPGKSPIALCHPTGKMCNPGRKICLNRIKSAAPTWGCNRKILLDLLLGLLAVGWCSIILVIAHLADIKNRMYNMAERLLEDPRFSQSAIKKRNDAAVSSLSRFTKARVNESR
jgi:hypothetical protein